MTAEKESLAIAIPGNSLSSQGENGTSGGEYGTEGLEAWGAKEVGPLLSLCKDSQTVPPWLSYKMQEKRRKEKRKVK